MKKSDSSLDCFEHGMLYHFYDWTLSLNEEDHYTHLLTLPYNQRPTHKGDALPNGFEEQVVLG